MKVFSKKHNDASPIIDRQSLFREIVDSSDYQFQEYCNKAVEITQKHFAGRRRLFNPIYVSDVCVNDCLYCGFRQSNKLFKRITLNSAQSLKEATFLLSRGVKNILILTGEYYSSKYFEMLIEHIMAIKKVQPSWLGVEVAPLKVEQYRQLSSLGVNSIIVFQETYNPQIYQYLHGTNTPKSDFNFRYETPMRAMKGGIKEIGLGVLYGIGDWFKDTLAMIEHANKLIEYNPEIKIRFSFPRIQFSSNQCVDIVRQEVKENMLTKIIVAIRLLFPTSRLALTARESQNYRLTNMNIVTDVGEGGSTVVGGYTIYPESEYHSQFKLSGRNSLNSFISKMKSFGYIL